MTLRITLSTIDLAKGILVVYLQTYRKKLQTIYKYSPYLHTHISVFLRHKFVADCDPLCSGLYLLIKPKQCIDLSWLFSGQYFIYIGIHNYHWVAVEPGNTYHNQDTVCLLTKKTILIVKSMLVMVTDYWLTWEFEWFWNICFAAAHHRFNARQKDFFGVKVSIGILFVNSTPIRANLRFRVLLSF